MYYCDICNFNTSYKNDYSRHMVSKKHKIKTGNVIGYECNICNYNTKFKNAYTKHMESKKHFEKVNEIEKNISPTVCKYCCKEYHTKKSLWKHKQTCNEKPEDEPNDEFEDETEDETEDEHVDKPTNEHNDDESEDCENDEDEEQNTPNVLMEVITNLRKEMDELKKSKVVDESQKRDDVIIEILKKIKD